MLIFIYLHRYGEVYERRALPFLLNVKRGGLGCSALLDHRVRTRLSPQAGN